MNLLSHILWILLLSASFTTILAMLENGASGLLTISSYLLLAALGIGILYCLTIIIAELIGFSQAHKKIDHKKMKSNKEILRNKQKTQLKSDISLLKKIWLYYDVHPVISNILIWLIMSIAFLLFMLVVFFCC